MAITPGPGYQVDPNNPNAVIPIGTTAQAQQIGSYNTGTVTPVSQTPPAPVQQPTTPAAPTVVVNNTPAPQPAAPQTTTQQTSPQQTGATANKAATSGTLTMPANGSVVDLLNAAGQDSSFSARQQLAQQYGIQGYTGTAAQNQELSKKYLEAFNANKSTAAPQSGAEASSALNTYFQENPAVAQEDPQQTFFDQYMAMNPIVKTMYDTINNELSSTKTTQTFAEEYKALLDQQGIQGLQTELMNVKNIMDGTEDDIRAEIAKTGGFATESQVQALAGARNKTLLKQANVLQQQLALKQDYVDQIMQFSKLDRDQVEKEVDRKLGLTEKLAAIQESMTSAAKDNYKTIIDKAGFTGLATALQNDPGALHLAEQSLGLPAGTLQNEAFLASTVKNDAKALQFVSGTANQASGYFDPNTGKFTAYGGGGGSGGGGGVSTSAAVATATPEQKAALQTALQTILGSGSFTKLQQQNIVNAVNNSSDPFTTIKNQAKNIMGQTLATSLSNNEKAKKALLDLSGAMDAYYKQGGKTDIFTGSFEQASARLGTVSDPKLRQLATQIESALQIYRNAVSGTAYSVQEGKAIAGIFPGIDKTKGLNDAIVAGRTAAFDSVIDDSYAQVLGLDTYEVLKQAFQPTQNLGTTNQVVTVNGKTYSVGDDGQTLTPVNSIDFNAINFK